MPAHLQPPRADRRKDGGNRERKGECRGEGWPAERAQWMQSSSTTDLSRRRAWMGGLVRRGPRAGQTNCRVFGGRRGGGGGGTPVCWPTSCIPEPALSNAVLLPGNSCPVRRRWHHHICKGVDIRGCGGGRRRHTNRHHWRRQGGACGSGGPRGSASEPLHACGRLLGQQLTPRGWAPRAAVPRLAALAACRPATPHRDKMLYAR